MTKQIVIPSNLTLWHSGKVRDTADLPTFSDLMLPVASDRVSTHNKLHLSLIPDKGELLTAQMLFFAFEVFKAYNIPTHLVAWGKKIHDYLPEAEYDPRLHYRAVVVKRWKLDPVEFIYRRFLPESSSLSKLYRDGLDPYVLGLPPGLPNMHKFTDRLFTPTDKSETDDPLPSGVTAEKYPQATHWTGLAFDVATDYLAMQDITLIDGKLEGGELGIADEWFTGDSCRLAWTKDVREGSEPPWLDKEDLRREAADLWAGGAKVPLAFSPKVIQRVRNKYHEAFEGITNMTLPQFQKRFMD